jgi:L-ribulose-5-phosphate 3-epimerase UlaE
MGYTEYAGGEGMVDFKTYFKLLKQYRIMVPVTLHLEYP